MIERVYMSSEEQEKLFRLTNHHDNYLGIGVYLRYADAPAQANFIGFQQVGRMREFGKPEYNAELVERVQLFLEERAGMENPSCGIIGMGIRSNEFRARFSFGDAPKELVGFLKIAGKGLNEHLYMLVNLTDMKLARLVLGEGRIDPVILPGQPDIISSSDEEWSQYFREEWQKIRKPADYATALLLE
jgi:hypothetical protein